MSFPQRGDRVTCQTFPPDYPLVVLTIAGGRVAIGSPLWPVGATRAVEPHQITSIHGIQILHTNHPQPKQPKQRRAAA